MHRIKSAICRMSWKVKKNGVRRKVYTKVLDEKREHGFIRMKQTFAFVILT